MTDKENWLIFALIVTGMNTLFRTRSDLWRTTHRPVVVPKRHPVRHHLVVVHRKLVDSVLQDPVVGWVHRALSGLERDEVEVLSAQRVCKKKQVRPTTSHYSQHEWRWNKSERSSVFLWTQRHTYSFGSVITVSTTVPGPGLPNLPPTPSKSSVLARRLTTTYPSWMSLPTKL